ncbi:MAG: ATP-binding cassette domain-containing protein [Desulfarculaceae bacterium]|nr:ATP-binding cassette domain-containing protein [Desulfarculaceae bacterium]MCF8047418.1 ATP-binding cassette domain-containing protein [Desulfarculaceae bacterium]MCF8063985.1 ATP-binding cassette domain-containing protein [Desulfarculaceae bacterium]MCF8097024.1 ATP-binding cassette domain-containing protein [Desulfarculaceae bacterium]MCF8122076.1 ATP-binding cassette domain-containing protein [Desulfarculaceae bacterium]
MALINLFDVSLAFGGPNLLDRIGFRVQPGERVCLLGRNGAGKSSLLKVLAGTIPPDSGEVSREVGLETGYLPQNVPGGMEGEVYEVAAQELGPMGDTLIDLRRGQGGAQSAEQGNDQDLWLADRRLRTVLTRLGLDPGSRVETLSGGLKRRVLLARALAMSPQLLLLDEPTNHLDIKAIVWLEEFLANYQGAMVFISHDRAFARNLATRVVELDRGSIYDWNCPYDEFLRRREEALNMEQEQRAKFDKMMTQEEAWLNRGLRARRTRDEGRVRRLMQMREQRAKRREVLGSARLQTQQAGLSGKVVAEVNEVGFAYDDAHPLIKQFSTLILRGDKIGIMGPNGSGKTTLLKILLGGLEPQSGDIRLGANLEIAYFDQMREELDYDKTVQENLAEGQDTLVIGGRQRHVISYLKDFLFSADRVHSPVRVLSGGERNRLLLAKLFAKPANLLVLDEPTNDLDRDTLLLLEDLLVEFEGTVLLVSHDRQFLNNVVAGTLVLEGGGVVGEYAGGYDDWLAQRAGASPSEQPKAPKPAKAKKRPPQDRPRKLSFNQKRELAGLPQRIEDLEREQAELHQRVSDPELYAKGGKEAAAISARLEELEREMEEVFSRWEELEAIEG